MSDLDKIREKYSLKKDPPKEKDLRKPASLTDEQKMKIDTRRKKLNKQPVPDKYSTGGTVSGMRRFYKGGKV